MGTANTAGVALAISLGGPGAMFWMWLTALVGGAAAFAESALGQLYKLKDGPNFRGGPACHFKQGLNMKGLGLVFAVIVAITYGIAFNSVQSNSIVDAVGASLDIDSSNGAFAASADTAGPPTRAAAATAETSARLMNFTVTPMSMSRQGNAGVGVTGSGVGRMRHDNRSLIDPKSVTSEVVSGA